MSLECYRSRGRNSYYYEGKKVSKKMASSLSPKLPKCVPKTKAKEIASLKKQLKEVLTHREQYKTTSSDLDSRLKACSIVKGEYDRLVDMINSANSSVDVMNRVCLTQDLKKQIDREYRELRETLESTTRSYDEKVEQLLKIVEKNKLDIEAYQSEVLSVNEENNNLREALKENANMIAGLGQQINQLQNEKAALLEEVNVRERIIYDKNGEIEERMRIIGRLDRENNELKNNFEKMASDYDDLKDNFEDVKQRARSVVAELQKENEGLKERVDIAENTIEEYKKDMGDADEQIRSLEEANNTLSVNFENLKEYMESTINQYKENIETLNIRNNALTVRATSLNETVESMRGSLEDCKDDKDILNMQEGQIDNLNAELNSVMGELQKTKNDLTTMRKDYDDEIDLAMRTKFERIKFQKEAEKCEADKAQLNIEIQELRSQAIQLRDAIQREKDECLQRIQQRIEETEGQISSREAKKYEDQLLDLNRELLAAQEVIDNLKNAQSSTGIAQENALIEAQNMMNDMQGGPQRQVMKDKKSKKKKK